MSRTPHDSHATPQQAPFPEQAAGTPPQERRKAPRVEAGSLPAMSAQLEDGYDIEVVNISKTGVLTRSHARLMPGAMIGLRVLTTDATFVLYGRVVRSRLLSIADGEPCYESALAFSSEFPLLSEDRVAPSVTATPPAADRTTPGRYPAEIGRLTGEPTLVTVTTFAERSREEVLKPLTAR
jgi:hypothetical protein